MMLPALLLLAIANHSEIAETTATVPPADWHARRFSLRKAGTVDISYDLAKGGAGVRLVLINRDDETKFALRREPKEFAATAFGTSGRIRAHVDRPGDYSLLLDNRLEAKQTAVIKFRGVIVYDADPVEVRVLPWDRRLAVIASSLSFFLGVCFFAGRRIWRAVTERRTPGPPQEYA